MTTGWAIGPFQEEVNMYRIRYTVVLLLLCTLALCSFAQDKSGTKSKSAETRDVDPLALDVLKAVTQPIEQAQAFSFKALVSEEQLATVLEVQQQSKRPKSRFSVRTRRI